MGAKTGASIDKAAADDLAWLGSHILRNKDGLYNRFWTDTANPHFPYAQYHRNGLNGTETGGGYPDCKSWWEADDIGLRVRLLGQVEPSTWDKLKAARNAESLSGDKYDDAILRSILKFQNIEIDKSLGKPGYANMREIYIDKFGAGIAAYWNTTISTIGGAIGGALTGPAFDMLKQALPYIQSLILFSLAISLPLVLVFSGYSVKAMMEITLGWFSVYFLSFIWEVSFFLDRYLYETMYGGFIEGIERTTEGMVMNLVLNTMYIVIPALWLSFLGWAGIKAGAGLDNAISGASKNAQQSTQSVVDTGKSAGVSAGMRKISK